MWIQYGGKEPVRAMVLDQNGDPVTGSGDVKVYVRRNSDDYYFDWDDNTFKAIGSVTQKLLVMQEISAVNAPGEYHLDATGHVNGFNTATVTNPTDNETYFFTVIYDGVGALALNLPQTGSLRVGGARDSKTPVTL